MKRLDLVGVNVAFLQARINAERNVGRDLLAESIDILSIKRLRETEGSINNICIQAEKVLGNLAGTRIVRVERSDEGGGLAVGVNLVVDGTHWEDGALELGEFSGDFGVLAGFYEAVFQDVAEFDGALDDGEEFGGARVHVWGVHAAGVEEAERSGDTETGENGEGFNVLEVC